MRALSIRQPYAELILRRVKKVEYRSTSTNIRERVLIYASKKPAEDPASWRKVKKQPGDLPTGVLVGTIEVCDCRGKKGDYRWLLRAPKRLSKLRKPKNHPQPKWFYP